MVAVMNMVRRTVLILSVFVFLSSYALAKKATVVNLDKQFANNSIVLTGVVVENKQISSPEKFKDQKYHFYVAKVLVTHVVQGEFSNEHFKFSYPVSTEPSSPMMHPLSIGKRAVFFPHKDSRLFNLVSFRKSSVRYISYNRTRPIFWFSNLSPAKEKLLRVMGYELYSEQSALRYARNALVSKLGQSDLDKMSLVVSAHSGFWRVEGTCNKWFGCPDSLCAEFFIKSGLYRECRVKHND
jgi:hypothetical protein